MSQRPLLVGDSVKVYIDDINHSQSNARIGFGFIRFIGFIPSLECGKFTQSIGIELIEEIYDGHDGTINNRQYFNVQKGYGIIVPITNIIKVVSSTDLMLELRKMIQLIQEKNDYIERLEGIVSSKKNYLPRRTPTMLTKINVNLPPNPPLGSNPNSFMLPGPITPITPNTPNVANTPNSMNSMIYSPNTPSAPSRISFPRINVQKRPSIIVDQFEPSHFREPQPSHLRAPSHIGAPSHIQAPSNISCSGISMVSSRHSSISESFPSISFDTSDEPSITDNSKFSSLSVSTPITPFTPTSPNVSFVIHEVGTNDVNHTNDVNYTNNRHSAQQKRYNTDRLHPNHQYSTSTSFSRRVSLLYKTPIPEVRDNNDDNKKRRKSAKMRKTRRESMNQNKSYHD